MDITIRVISADEIHTFIDHTERAFGHRFSEDTDDGVAEVVEPERSIVAEEGGAIVGTTGAYSFDLSVPGGELPAAGVTMVGVLPSHRRRGVLREMMRHQLDDVVTRGEPLAVLWASEGQIYGRFGYGLATLGARIDILRDRARFATPVPEGVRYRLVEVDEGLKTMADVYERVRSYTPGFFARSETWWREHRLRDPEHMRGGGGPMFRVIVEIDGSACAYGLYRVHSHWEQGSPSGRLEVIEAVADGAAATRALWGFLFGIDLVARIESWALPADLPLMFMIEEPRRLRTTLSDGLWLRVVDVAEALRGRRYSVDGSVVLEVDDRLIEANRSRFRLTAHGGAGRVERCDDPPELSLGISELGSVYLGGVGVTALAAAGRITEHRPGAAGTADQMFAWHRTPWCPEIF